MPFFYVLHVARFPTPLGKLGLDGKPLLGTEVVFSRLKDREGKPMIVSSDEPENAFAHAKRRFPHLAHSLAVEPVPGKNHA